jgi:hypothetical protein
MVEVTITYVNDTEKKLSCDYAKPSNGFLVLADVEPKEETTSRYVMIPAYEIRNVVTKVKRRRGKQSHEDEE